MTLSYKDYAAEEFETLAFYSKTVAKVHGNNHPELAEVRDIFLTIKEKTQAAGEGQPELDSEFQELRRITSNYTTPADGCETYEATYNMLKTADQAYSR